MSKHAWIISLLLAIAPCVSAHQEQKQARSLTPRDSAAPSRCEDLLAVHALLARAQAECGFKEHSLEARDSAATCFREIGERRTLEIATSSMQQFDRNVAAHGGEKSRYCEVLRADFPEMVPEGSRNGALADSLQITSAVVGSVPTSNNTLGVPKNVFHSRETIYLSIGTTALAPERLPATLAVNWTYDFRGETMAVHAEGEEIRSTGAHMSLFQISRPNGWPKGNYQAEILVDGKSIRKIGLTVK